MAVEQLGATAGDKEVSPAGLCWDCNYSLQGLDTARCPECGRGFDPSDPESVNHGKPMGRFARRLLRPAPWQESVSYIYTGLALVAAALVPTNRWIAVLMFFLWWLLASLPYFVRAALRHAVVRRYGQPDALSRVDERMMLRVGRVTLWAALIVFAQVPLYLTLLISMPWLDALGGDRYARMPFVTVNNAPLTRQYYGVFRVRRVRVDVHGADVYLWRDDYGAPRLRYAPGSASLRRVLDGSQLTPTWRVE